VEDFFDNFLLKMYCWPSTKKKKKPCSIPLYSFNGSIW